MKKYLFIIIAALAMVGCENNGVEQNNELVGKTFRYTVVPEKEYDDIKFNTISKYTYVNFVERLNPPRIEGKGYYTFTDSTIVLFEDKEHKYVIDTLIYHVTYLSRGIRMRYELQK